MLASRKLLKPNGERFRVLLVDDSVYILKQLASVLTAASCEIADTAQNGQEGLEKYMSLFPDVDLVTLDITMPKMHGIDCLQAIRAFDSQAKVLMMSAVSGEDTIKKCLLLGARAYIVKPLNPEIVLDHLSSILL